MKEPLIDLYRILQKLDEKLILSELPELSPKVNAALEFVEENFSRGIGWKDAAAYVGMHPVSLSRRIHEELREHQIYISLPEYVDGLRVREAKRLIKSNPFLECKEVASMVGTGERNLRRIFKKYTGKNISRYKSELSSD